MSIEESYEWAKKQRAEWDKMVDQEHPMVSKLDVELSQGGDHQVVGLSFSRTECPSYVGEVGRNDDDDLIFHFWPTADDRYNVLTEIPTPTQENPRGTQAVWVFGDAFRDALAEAFLEVFKFEDKLCWDFVPEMNSWVVRASGFGSNVMADELSARVFDGLQHRIEK
jgi:hypothetical protein